MSTSRRGPATAVLLSAALAASVLLSGCGGDDDPERAGSTAAASTSAGSSEDISSPDEEAAPSTAPAFDGDTEPETAAASADASLTVTDLRAAGQDGFDRVVLEVGGTGTPGWDVRYVDQAAAQGSGAPIDLPGSAALQVTVSGVGYPFETGQTEYAGPRRLTPADTGVVTDVVWDATFEGTTVVFAGMEERAPFRVYALQDPARVVVEVAR